MPFKKYGSCERTTTCFEPSAIRAISCCVYDWRNRSRLESGSSNTTTFVAMGAKDKRSGKSGEGDTGCAPTRFVEPSRLTFSNVGSAKDA